jgi:hypothetical protein
LKIKHYFLLILTLLTIAFLQPLVMLLGGVTLLGGVAAFIFADLPPENQDAWEVKITGLLEQLRLVLSRPAERSQDSLSNSRRQTGSKMRRERMPLLEEDAGNTRSVAATARPADSLRDYRSS